MAGACNRGALPIRPRNRGNADLEEPPHERAHGADPVCGTFVVGLSRAVASEHGPRPPVFLFFGVSRQIQRAKTARAASPPTRPDCRRPRDQLPNDEPRAARLELRNPSLRADIVEDWPAHGRAGLYRVKRRQHQRAARLRTAAHDPEERLQGVHDARHDVHHGSWTAGSFRATATPRPRCWMHLEVYSAAALMFTPWCTRIRRRQQRIRRRGDSARSRGARRSRDHAREHSDRGVCDAVDQRELPGRRPQRREGARRHAAGEPRSLHGRRGSLLRVLQDGNDRATLRRISLVARLLGRENLIAREELDAAFSS